MARLEDRLINEYVAWLIRDAREEVVSDGCKALSLPFLDRHNDYLRVYVLGDDAKGLRITDDGQVLRDLRLAGCDFKAQSRRRALAVEVLHGLGLAPDTLDHEELSVTAQNGDFPEKLQSLLQAMLALDGLAAVSPPTVASMFRDDVADWLASAGAKFERNVEFPGRTGLAHKFDFKIVSDGKKDRIVQLLPDPDRTHVQSLAYEVGDTRAAMSSDAPIFFAMLGHDRKLGRRQAQTLLKNDINPVRWENRDSSIKERIIV